MFNLSLKCVNYPKHLIFKKYYDIISKTIGGMYYEKMQRLRVHR